MRDEWGVSREQVLVLNISCLKPQKAPLDYVRAAAQATRLESRLHFALVGDGELRSEVEAAVRAAGLEGRFHLPGWRKDVAAILHAADIVVLTSHWEGLPRVLIQARAAGRPIVATRVNGTPEAVAHGANGYLTEAGDMQALAVRIVELARDSELRRAMGAAGRVGLEEFDQVAMVDAQEQLYITLLERRLRGARHVLASSR